MVGASGVTTDAQQMFRKIDVIPAIPQGCSLNMPLFVRESDISPHEIWIIVKSVMNRMEFQHEMKSDITRRGLTGRR